MSGKQDKSAENKPECSLTDSESVSEHSQLDRSLSTPSEPVRNLSASFLSVAGGDTETAYRRPGLGAGVVVYLSQYSLRGSTRVTLTQLFLGRSQ